MIDKAYRREKYLVKCKITPQGWKCIYKTLWDLINLYKIHAWFSLITFISRSIFIR